MLFKHDSHAGIASGAITLTFRNWKRPQAKPRGRYRVGAGLIEVDSIQRVPFGEITDSDARRAGLIDTAALRALLAPKGPAPTAAQLVYRVAFHYLGLDARPGPVTDAAFDADELAAIVEKLAAMDHRAKFGPWIRATLDAIDARPRLPASKLASSLNRDTQPFKADVRKLKRLGLTISHDIGYELSPRGVILLDRLRSDPPTELTALK